jgi:ribosomal protein L16 Arg81 hydroxylase
MISTLPELTAPLSEADFLDRLRTRQLVFHRAQGENRFAGLIDWGMIADVVKSGSLRPDKLFVAVNRHPLQPVFYVRNGRIDPAKFDALVSRGAGMVVAELDEHLPALRALCDDIRGRVGERIVVNGNVSIGGSGILKLHYDCIDIVVLQIEGSKRWCIYGSPVPDPVKGMKMPPPPDGEPVFDEILRPGDFLFVPAGYWHVCDSPPERSLHLALCMCPPSGWEAIGNLLPELLEEKIFRVPITRLNECEKAVYEAAMKKRLIEKINAMSLTDMLAAGKARENNSG